jgi:hypothetical protein
MKLSSDPFDELFISGRFRRANLENLNLLTELLNVKERSSAEDENV